MRAARHRIQADLIDIAMLTIGVAQRPFAMPAATCTTIIRLAVPPQSRRASTLGLARWSDTTAWGWRRSHCRYETCRPLRLGGGGAVGCRMLVDAERRAIGQGKHPPRQARATTSRSMSSRSTTL